MTARGICRTSLIAVVLVGVALLLMGLVIDPILPYVQLDRVLSPDELADPQARDQALELLRKARGHVWVLWTVAGVVAITAGFTGLAALSRVGDR